MQAVLLTIPDEKITELFNTLYKEDELIYPCPAVTLQPSEQALEEAKVAEAAIAAAAEEATAAKAEAGADGEEEEEEEEEDEEADAKATADEGEIPIDKVRWMFETENGWKVHSDEVSKTIEIAKRGGLDECSVRITETQYTCKIGQPEDMHQNSEAGKQRLRRHILGPGLAGSWEVLSYKFQEPMSLRGEAALGVLEKVAFFF